MVPTDDDALGRGRLTNTKRIELLERDRAQQSRTITELVDTVSRGFTSEQLGQIRSIMTEVLADAGLRVEDAEQQDEAREDFRFVRRFRKGLEGTASKIGWVVIAAILGGVFAIVTLGLNAWRGGA